MPLYRYVCEGCDHSFTKLHRTGSDGHEPECPECGSDSVNRVISSVGIRFKGNGFYRTDYGNNGSGGSSRSSSEGSESSASSASSDD